MPLCAHCNINEAAPRVVGHTRSRFCQRACSQAARRRVLSSVQAPVNCKECGVLVPPKPVGKPGREAIYCGETCGDKAARRRRVERDKTQPGERPTNGRASAVQPGIRFGKLVVQECFARHARAECDCGTTKIVVKHNLLAGDTTSCGCVRLELLKQAREARALKGETFISKNRVGFVRKCRPRAAGRYGVCSIEPPVDGDDSPVCYLVSTRDEQTEHSTFDEARVEYLIRSGRMSA